MKTICTIAFLSGIGTGLLCFALFVVLAFADLKPLAEHSFWYFPLYGLGLSAGMWYMRFRINRGFLHGWQSICIGLITNTIACAVYGLCIWALLAQRPAMVEAHKQNIRAVSEQYMQQAEKEEDKKIYQDFLDKELPNVTAYTISLDVGLKTGVIGFVFALLFGAFFRRKPTVTQAV